MTDLGQSTGILRFEAFELNRKTGELHKSGVKIRLQEQSFQILATLLEQPGKLVTRESLHERLWSGDTFVDFEKGLNIAVSKLRQALGDSADKPRFIETLPRRGYRFMGAVEKFDESGEIIGLPTGSAAQRTISHYRLLEKLGEGGMGVVYKALDTKLNRTVALKFLAPQLTQDPKAKERFQREAQAAAAVDHPNICTVHEIDEVGGQIFIAMAYIEGQSLDKKIVTGPLAFDETLDIAIQTAQGLQAAHEKGVVHRDIKSSNLVLTKERQVKILDFGLARLADQSRLTQSTAAVGTPSCMSPEQVQRQPTDYRTDVWSLGVVIYEMITGRVPFEGGQEQAVLFAVVHEQHQPVTALRAGLPLELDQVIGKALAKNPAERYQHMDEMAVDLRHLRNREPRRSAIPGAAVTQAESTAVAAPRGRRWLPWAVAGVATAALLAISFLYFRDAPSGGPLRRFSVTAPEIYRPVWAYAPPVLISPNGRHVVFISEGKESKLWVQDLDQWQPRPLGGTDGARAPFWAPDSQTIGFFAGDYAGGEVRKISVHGGPVIPICKVAGGEFAGASWSPDGESIVFSSMVQLYQVPASGGAASLVVSRDEFVGQQGMRSMAVRAPHFLPSEAGERVLGYTIGTLGNSTMVVQDLETGRRQILGLGALLFYSRSGHIVHYTSFADHGLWALPFSLGSLRATGNPFRVAEGADYPSLSSNGTLVYLDGFSTKRNLVWLDRTGARVGDVLLTADSLNSPALSPDGRQVAYTAAVDGNMNIWVLDLIRGTSRKLTENPQADFWPVWSPKSDRLVFNSNRTGKYTLYLCDIDRGFAEEPIPPASAAEIAPNWSRDGKYLFHGGAGSGLWFRVRSESTGGWHPNQFAQEGGFPRISPNGRYVAYLGRSEGGFPDVYVRPFPNGGRATIVSKNGASGQRWSRDGKELFFLREDALVAVEFSTDGDLSIGSAVELFRNRGLINPVTGDNYGHYDVSADGQRFLVAEPVERNGISNRTIRVVQNWFSEFKDRRQ